MPGERHTGQLVAATIFDYRGFDTLGEEMILFAAACGCAALLRVLRREREEEEGGAGAAGAELRGAGDGRGAGRPGPGPRRLRHRCTATSPRAAASRAASIVAGALLLAYAAGQGVRLRRVRLDRPARRRPRRSAPPASWRWRSRGLIAAGALLKNFLALGTSGMLLSAGTIPVGNVAVGLEVAGAVALVFAEFLEQALLEDPG